MCSFHGNAVFATDKICVLHINIFRWTSVPTFMKIDQKLREEFATQDLSPLLPIICRYHGNTFSDTIEKYVLHIYTPRQTSVPSFMEIGQKLRKWFATQDFPSFWLIICELLPWQHTFCHCWEMCYADLHPKTNIQYEFHENWPNADEAVLPWSILP